MEKAIITADQFKSVFPKADAKFVDSLVRILPAKGINTLNRVASFIAQCGHESGDFKFYIENLNYSDTALMVTFKKYFPTKELALAYARKPEKIANLVYANRMGNGSPESGDGWAHRGRGLIQLTGKINYIAFAKYINKTLQETLKYCETMDGAVESAVWFWITNDCNKFADADDIKLQTRRINGGFNGLEHREKLYAALKIALKTNF